ncbi:MAG: GAF domain-containing protein, partial [Deltaproteobacteria bacterium]|nr:GAF domain-containing protein [Deltaproteobacteria bacterium]
AGTRTVLGVPLLSKGEMIGAFFLSRQAVRPFTDKQIDLVKNFAAQAGIAIESARLLNELRQRTDDLTESLEQQTATSEVLKVISSSPGNLQPVFQAMLSNAVRICEAKFGVMFRFDGDLSYAIATVQLAGTRTVLGVPLLSKGEMIGAFFLSRQAVRPFTDKQIDLVKNFAAQAGRRRDLSYRGPPLHRQADRAGAELRRPSRDRHREHAAA